MLLGPISITLSHNIQIPGLPRAAGHGHIREERKSTDKRKGMEKAKGYRGRGRRVLHSPTQRTRCCHKFCFLEEINKRTSTKRQAILCATKGMCGGV